MKTNFVYSDRAGNFKEIFRNNLFRATQLDWAVAFGQHSAFKFLKEDFSDFFKKGGISRAVFDLSSGLTDPTLIEELATYPGESLCKVYCGDSHSLGIFHHKLYIFQSGVQFSALVGSLNFSKTAFFDNHESCMHLQGEPTEDVFKNISSFFQNEIWNNPYMISPEADEKILILYRELHAKQNTGTRSRTRSAKNLQGFLEEIAKSQFQQEKLSFHMAYLAGLLCASAYNLRIEDIANRTITFKYKSAKKNSNDPQDSGFICARVEQELLGGIRLPQYETQKSTIKRIYADLSLLLSWDDKDNEITLIDKSSKQTTFDIEMKFTKKSKVFSWILECLSNFRRDGDKYFPMIPENVMNSKEPHIHLHFLKGYFDFRSRVSKSDRYPSHPGKMRVAIQIGTNDVPFAEQLQEILSDTFQIDSQLARGSSRGKDNMIRMLPTRKVLKFWSSGHERMLINAFIDFNENMDNQLHSAGLFPHEE
jgi:HKD family nuclease